VHARKNFGARGAALEEIGLGQKAALGCDRQGPGKDGIGVDERDGGI